MADVPLVVRVAANLDTLRANLAEGVSQIETTKVAMQQMATAYDGSRAIAQAGAVTAAIQQIGGVTKLTAEEQAKALPLLDQAIAKYAALGKDAPPGMKAIADSIRGSQGAWESFIGGFNIKEAISDPLGTATAAAVGFTEALGPIGVAITAGIAALGGLSAAAFELTNKAGMSGERLVDLSLKTGMAIEPLSKLSKAATIAGADIDQVGTAMFMFGKNTEEHGDKVAKGMDKIGLSLSEIKKLAPDQQFLAIAEALSKIPDPMQRNAAASELFGRSARDLMPLLMEINEAMDRTKNMGGWTTEQAKDAKEFEMDLRQLNIQIDAVEMGIGKQLLPAFKELTGFATEHAGVLKLFLGPIDKVVTDFMLVELAAKRILGMTPPTQTPDVKAPSAFGATDGGVDAQAKALADEEVAAARLEARLKNLLDATANLTLTQKSNIEELHKVGASEKDIADLVRTSVDAVHAYIESEKELARQQAQTDAVLMVSYEKRVAGLKAVTEANLHAYDFGGQIASLTQLMASEEAMARAVYAQLTSEKDRAKVIEELALKRIEIQSQINGIEQRHAGLVNAQIIAELDARRQLEAAVGRNVDGTTGELNGYEKMMLALDRLHDKKQAGISQYNQENLIIKQYTDSEYAIAVATDAATAAENKNTEALKAKTQAIKDAAAAAYKAAQDLGGKNAFVPTSASLTSAGIIASTQSVSGFDQLQHRATGGPVLSGQPYFVGENGPELFVPDITGSIIPHGMSAQAVSSDDIVAAAEAYTRVLREGAGAMVAIDDASVQAALSLANLIAHDRDATPAVAALTASQRAYIETAIAVGGSTKDIGAVIGETSETVALYAQNFNAAAQAATAAQRATEQASASMAAKLPQLQDQLRTATQSSQEDEIQQQIDFYSKLGVTGMVDALKRDLAQKQGQDHVADLVARRDQEIGSLAGLEGTSGYGEAVALIQQRYALLIPGRASGGAVGAGMPYMVGERGPELFVPSSSGAIVPNGGSSVGGSTTIQIYVTQPLGSPDAIARAVDQALMARQRNTGQRLQIGN